MPNALHGAAQTSPTSRRLADRLQQGFLDFMFLGRTMIHPAGLASNPAFQRDGRPLIDTRRLFYYGNSQGGIAGGALTAVAPDFDRSVLYVGAMNYSLLLNRSVDYDDYALDPEPVLPEPAGAPARAVDDPDPLGPRRAERLRLAHDRRSPAEHAEAQGAPDPVVRRPPGREPRHRGRGAHASARTCGCPRWTRAGTRIAIPYYGIPPIRHFPYDGDASLVVWDIGPLRPPGCGVAGAPECLGTPTPPTANVPPRVGVDPHDLVIESEARVRRQISEFLRVDGRLIDVCGAFPCHAAGWAGP